MEAIILAGGLGTRLREKVHQAPKSMAIIDARPFLEYQLDRFIRQGVSRFIFSVGYKSEMIRDHFSDEYKSCEIVYAVETSLLGTGGAIKNAMRYVQSDNVVVANGDSLFYADLRKQYDFHLEHDAQITLALKPMRDFERYGTVRIDTNGRITRFNEKQAVEAGLINGGLYIIHVAAFSSLKLPDKFSIEKEIFESRVSEVRHYGFVSDGYFLDIGIPDDFERAQYEIGVFSRVAEGWTLFLDRDGVINKKLDGDYVKTPEEFEFLPMARDALVSLSQIFDRLVIVTNQQGIGKGLMTEIDLLEIHRLLRNQVLERGGRVDAVYHAPELIEEDSVMRKPAIGMAHQAQTDFPEIDFRRSIMIGDSVSDMKFAESANMTGVFVDSQNDDHEYYTISSLGAFSELLISLLRP